MVVFLSLLACSDSDFGLSGVKDPVAKAEDTAAPFEDTAETADTAPEDTADSDTQVTEDTAPTDTAPPEDTATPDDPAPTDDCTETDDLIYVLSRDDSTLYTFDPASLTFSSLGKVDCGTSQTPGSMAVNRSGTAYVRYADNSLYSLDLASMTCSSTTYSDRRTHFDSFGMGYSTDSADTWREQLYIANATTLGLLDPSTGTVTTLGRMPSQSELTGNADGELWAILPLETPAELVQIDKTNGTTLATITMRAFPDPSGIDTFAFATWSGDFYVFVREYGMGSSTDVYKVTSTGAMSKVLSDVGFDVVGAGVSTCAPS